MYFFMPTQVGFAFILDLRMAPFVGMSAMLLIGSINGFVANATFVMGTAFVLAQSVFHAHMMRRFETEEAARFELMMRNLPPGKKLLMLIFRRDSDIANVAPFVHFGSYYRARRGGIASFSFSELPHWPLRYRPENAPPKKSVTFWDWNPCMFRNTTDGPYYDFVLTRGEVDPFFNKPPGPKWSAIGGAREWKLYAKTTGAWNATPGAVDPGPCELPPQLPPYAE